MDDVSKIRDYVLTTLNGQFDQIFAKEGIDHLLSVGHIAACLALKHGLNTNLALIAGYLHDIAFYTTHYHVDHAKRSAKMAIDILSKKHLS